MREPRPFRDVSDLDLMKALLIEGKRANTGVFYVHPGFLDWWTYYSTPDGDDPRTFSYLWEGENGLDAWALISRKWWSIDVFFHPKLCGSPDVEEMFLWVERKIRAEFGEPGDRGIQAVWISEKNPWLVSIFRRLGFTDGKYSTAMLERKLDGEIPDHELPPGYTLRAVGGEANVEMRARAQYAAFESDWEFERYLFRWRTFMRSPGYNPEHDLIVVSPEGETASFCIIWLDPVNRIGEFEPVGTDPKYQRKGLGRAVMLEGLRRMQAAGMETAHVCTGGDNDAAIHFYQSLGFELAESIPTRVKTDKPRG